MIHRCFSLAILILPFLVNAKGLSLDCDTVWGPVIVDSGCEAYVWNGEMYTESGTYKQHFTALTGCDSVVTLQLTIADIDTMVTMDGATLTVWQFGAMYQWVDCDAGNAPIEGATWESFTPAHNGNYAVIVTLGDCSAISGCHAMISTAMHEQGKEEAITVAPDPAHDHFTIRGHAPLGEVLLLDPQGHVVHAIRTSGSVLTLSVNDLRAGLYTVRCTWEARTCTQRLVVE